MVLAPIDSVAFGRMDLDHIRLARSGTAWVFPRAARYAVVGIRPSDNGVLWITREGQGPAEFRFVQQLAVGPGDSLYVVGDGKINRYTSSGEFVRTRRIMTEPMAMSIQMDGSYVIGGVLLSSGGPEFGIHVFSSDDELLASTIPPDWPNPRTWASVLAPAVGGGFWVGRRNAYRIIRLDPSGRALGSVRRDVPWFEPYEEWEPPYEEPPLPRLWSVQEDDEGRLWVMLYVADRSFEPLPDPTPENLHAPLDSTDPTFDTLIEVIDLESGRALAERRFDGLLGGFLRTHHLVEPDVDEHGEQFFRILRLGLDDLD